MGQNRFSAWEKLDVAEMTTTCIHDQRDSSIPDLSQSFSVRSNIASKCDTLIYFGADID